jgi:hypothetical protein
MHLRNFIMLDIRYELLAPCGLSVLGSGRLVLFVLFLLRLLILDPHKAGLALQILPNWIISTYFCALWTSLPVFSGLITSYRLEEHVGIPSLAPVDASKGALKVATSGCVLLVLLLLHSFMKLFCCQSSNPLLLDGLLPHLAFVEFQLLLDLGCFLLDSGFFDVNFDPFIHVEAHKLSPELGEINL